MAKNKLPTTDSPVVSTPREDDERERKYKAEDSLRTLERAEEIKKDRALMKDVKKVAKERIKNASKFC